MKGVIVIHWPPNMAAHYQDKLIEGCILRDAWQEIPKGALIEIVDKVRNTTLRMALEIKEEVGGSNTDLGRVNASVTERIQHIVINNVGDVAFGNVDASHQTVIVAGDRKTLDAALVKAGLDQTDLNELSEAILVDGGSKPGNRVTEWVQSKTGKVIVGWCKGGGEHRTTASHRLAPDSCWPEEAIVRNLAAPKSVMRKLLILLDRNLSCWDKNSKAFAPMRRYRNQPAALQRCSFCGKATTEAWFTWFR